MDESTRQIIAYALLLLGIPLLGAKILWFVPGNLAGIIVARISDRLQALADAVAEGFLSLLLACLIFNHLDIPVVSAVPALLIAFHLVWNWAVNRAAVEALPSVAGIGIGFLLYPKVLASLPPHLVS